MGSISNNLFSTPVSTSSSTSSSSSGSASGSATNSSSSSTDYFMGTSSYSQDLQQVIDRAVSIASLPINVLTDQQNELNAQSADLTKLDTQFSSLQSAVQGIADALGGSNFQTTISQPSAVSANITDGAAEGDYTVNVTNIGAYAESVTTQDWNAAPDTSGNPATYTLMVNGKGYAFTPADDSATSVAAAINAQYSNLVNALAVNVGSADNPEWRISLQSSKLGPMNLDIQGPPPGLQEQQDAVNGYSTSQTAASWNSTADPLGNPTTYNLVIGNNSYAITAADNNIQTVVNAINNSQYSSQVKATIVNVAKSGDPADNRIQFTSTTTGAKTLDLVREPPSLQVQQAAQNGYSVSQTAATWDSTPDPLGNPTTYNLIVGGKSYTVLPTDNSAQSVAAAINQQYGSLVTATVVNGPGGVSDPRIQLTSTQTTPTTLDLQKTSSLQNMEVTGALATYEMLNTGKSVSSNTRTVTVAPGVNLTLEAQSNGPLDVIVTRSTTALDSALSQFADTYNATVDLVDTQHGQSSGSLQGQSILSSLSQALSSIATYGSTTGSISSLEALGLKLGTDGHFTYEVGNLWTSEYQNSAGVTAFLGSTTGGGFLKTATDALNNLEASGTGLLKLTEQQMQSRITSLGTQISQKTDQLQQLQQNLQTRMAAADAMIAQMQQQYSYLNDMFQAQQTADQMYK
ncbi:MAG TPA: flagellar filament capping protein FliD [Bryobacteraceae bacterium]|nr:flagellar filament capping protein FliD [Bryobacteraceae bacterium]